MNGGGVVLKCQVQPSISPDAQPCNPLPSGKPWGEAEAHMQWEYEIVQVSDVGNLQKTLNVKGEMGWEAVGAFVSGRSPAVILKREKASKSN